MYKKISAEMIDHFQWPGLYGVMSWFPSEPCKISGQQTLVRWYVKDKQKKKAILNALKSFHKGRPFSWAGQVRVSECDSGSALILHTSGLG